MKKKRQTKEKEAKKTSEVAILEGDRIPPGIEIGVIVGRGIEVYPGTLSALAATSAKLTLSAMENLRQLMRKRL